MSRYIVKHLLDTLRSYNLKEVKPNEYQCNSPLRAGSDSGAFSITINADGQSGAWFDFVSEEGGSLHDLARRLGLSDKPAVQSTKRTYSSLEDYAKAHGIPGETLRAAGWVEATCKGRRALLFPTASGKRWRFLDEAKPYYISENGYKRCWYGLNDRLRELLQKGAVLVITNGEISTLAGQHWQIAAACVTAGENELSEEHLKTLRAFLYETGVNPQVLIALDCDTKGRHAARGIQTQMRRAGFNARAIDLQLGLSGDLADFVMLYGDEAAQRLPELPSLIEPTAVAQAKIPTVKIPGLMKQPDIKYLLKPILPIPGLSMIYGASGSYKSFFVLDLALRLGTDHTVVYVAGEGESGFKKRVQAWMMHNAQMPDNIWFRLGATDLFSHESALALLEEFEQYKPKLVVIDTLQANSGDSDENTGRDMKRVLANVKAIRDTFNCAVLLIHHTNKEGFSERGWGGLRNAMDTMFKLTKNDDIVTVAAAKAKEDIDIESYQLAPRILSLGRDEDGEEITSVVLVKAEQIIQDKELTSFRYAVLEVFEADSEISYESAARLLKSSGDNTSEGSVNRAMKVMRELGYVNLDGKRKTITSEGLAAMERFRKIQNQV